MTSPQPLGPDRSASVDHYVVLRNRALKALDEVAAAAFTCATPDELFEKLLRVFMDTMPAVQSCVLLMREDDSVRVRAAVGLDEELVQGFAVRVGEGFAGAIAATGKPSLLHCAASPIVHRAGVKAFYGVPVRHATKGVIGVPLDRRREFVDVSKNISPSTFGVSSDDGATNLSANRGHVATRDAVTGFGVQCRETRIGAVARKRAGAACRVRTSQLALFESHALIHGVAILRLTRSSAEPDEQP